MASYQALLSQLTTPNLKMDPSYKVDEGYSEDTRSQDGLESPMSMEPGSYGALASQTGIGGILPSGIMALSEADRSEVAYKILRTLRVSSIASVVDRLWPCFHKDPIQLLPPEIMSQIFSYLTPSMLLEASRASKIWRERVLDSRLWKHKFRTEGWDLDVEEIERFENNHNVNGSGSRLSRVAQGKQRGPVRGNGGKPAMFSSGRSPQGARQRHKTYWPRPDEFRTRIKREEDGEESRRDFEDNRNMLVDFQGEEDRDLQAQGDDRDMRDAPTLSPVSDAQSPLKSVEAQKVSEFLQASEAQFRNERLALNTAQAETPQDSSDTKPERAPSAEQPLMLSPSSDHPRLNYHHVFKQKQKLEDNWNNGQYRCFQLPHRNHPEDAHTECVYTIQYSGKYLVSGSRDRTLRIWDLDTERLVAEPLHGHTGSVLCLQFDHSEEEDIIISGSSDTHVILWRFSTGKMIKQLTNAHRESVLNLKFDKRFLVTCSKDKTIKIWNRHELRPGDRDYPVKGISGGGECPAYIIDMYSIGSSLRNEQFNFSEVMLLEPYTLLMTLDLHGAAVNAIQIYKDELVSASGDRNLRVWNIHTGECGTKIEAHKKGIACVQYDGKRIVSGSSDNNICIWDPITKTEVARLEGHSRLVRTIQAAFADFPGGRDRLEAEADEVNRQWKAASIAGLIPAPTSAGRQPHVVPGSRRPRDIRSVGAKIPPSGGGSKWGRIVSGSYDETIIIWKKTDDDEWVIGHRLRQEEALRAAGPPLIPRSDLQNQTAANTRINQVLTQHNYEPNQANNQQANQALPAPTSQLQPHTAQFTNQGIQNQAQAQAQAQASNQSRPLFGVGGYHATPNGWPNPLAPPFTQQRQQPQQNVPPPQPQPQHQPLPQPHHAPPIPSHPAVAPVGQPNARVFKLQFDARRIICCSQDPKIVGWDFANGDEQIVECSRFFAAPQ